MTTSSVSRHPVTGIASLLSVGLILAIAIPALADYVGPNRTVSTWAWERLQCNYQAVYDEPGPGWYGCTLQLYAGPSSGCPSTGSVVGYFNTGYCSGWPDDCGNLPCSISLSTSTVGCTEGEPGCTAVEHFSTLPEASINGSVSCGVPGYSGWCLSSAALTLTGSEPLSGYSILALEGTLNGQTFGCLGASCSLAIPEGSSDFTYWAISSWGDTSRMGSATGRVDTQPPSISGSISGVAGDNGWYLSDVTFTAAASDASPGSGVAVLNFSMDGGGWSDYTGPLAISEGNHSLDLRAGDAAGNMSTESQLVRIDTQTPTLNLNTAATTFCPGCRQTLEVAFEVQDSLSGVAEWVLSADGATIASGSAAASQTLAWNGSGLPAGAHTLLLEARDAAGNTQHASRSVTLLAPPPQATSTPSRPRWTPSPGSPTAVSTSTRLPRPTSTASISGFDGPPVAPVGPGASPVPGGGPSSVVDGPSSIVGGPSYGVLWGAGALALVGAATAYALGQSRKRREEEARLRAKQEAKRERLRSAAAATAAAWVAEREAQEEETD